jgi:cystathionine beta-lyase
MRLPDADFNPRFYLVMAFNFDSCPERQGSDSTKWHKYASQDIIPCWIADMDFVSPPEVIEAVQKRAAHGVFGYPAQREAVLNAVVNHVRARHGWEIKPEWITFMCSLVPGIHATIRCASQPGESVVTTAPVYPPFLTAPVISERNPIKLTMVFVDGRWTFDWEKLEAACAQAQTKVLLLCSPYNPLARVFDRAELERLAAIVQKYDLKVCSDEIHCDLVLDPKLKHTVFATLSPEIASRTVTLMAASKTFNVAGLTCGFAIIPDATLRTKFRRILQGLSLDQNVFGLVATQAALEHGEPWRQACIEYLRGNLDVIEEALKRMPGVVLRQRPQASFLAWLDVSALGFENPHAEFEKGGIGFSNGDDFGGTGHVRLNFGCPRERLREILRRMEVVVKRAPRR